MSPISLMAWTIQTALAAERPRLVAFCAHLSGSWDAAEDLAQETLLEAWRPATGSMTQRVWLPG